MKERNERPDIEFIAPLWLRSFRWFASRVLILPVKVWLTFQILLVGLSFVGWGMNNYISKNAVEALTSDYVRFWDKWGETLTPSWWGIIPTYRDWWSYPLLIVLAVLYLWIMGNIRFSGFKLSSPFKRVDKEYYQNNKIDWGA